MTLSLTRQEVETLLVALRLAEDSEVALIDAHLSPYDRRPIRGSSVVIRDSERTITRMKKIAAKLKEEP